MKRPSSFSTKEHFRERLIQMRKAKGFTQQELADRIGVSQRVIAYYEKETEHLPANYLPLFAKAFGISIDELMGYKLTKEDLKPKNSKLWKRIRKIDDLPMEDQKTITNLIDAVIAKQQVNK